MPVLDLKLLVLALIGFDALIIVVFVYLIRKIRLSAQSHALDKPVGMFETLIKDADKTEKRLSAQMEEKQRLIKKLNNQLDQRIISLTVLLNRADILSGPHETSAAEANRPSAASNDQQAQILALARKGRRAEEIAQQLSIAKGEVQLVLNLKQTLSQAGIKGTGS